MTHLGFDLWIVNTVASGFFPVIGIDAQAEVVTGGDDNEPSGPVAQNGTRGPLGYQPEYMGEDWPALPTLCKAERLHTLGKGRW